MANIFTLTIHLYGEIHRSPIIKQHSNLDLAQRDARAFVLDDVERVKEANGGEPDTASPEYIFIKDSYGNFWDSIFDRVGEISWMRVPALTPPRRSRRIPSRVRTCGRFVRFQGRNPLRPLSLRETRASDLLTLPKRMAAWHAAATANRRSSPR